MRPSFARHSSRARALTPAIVRRIRVFFIAVASIIACVAIFFIGMGTREWMLAVESTSWPTTSCTIVSSRVTESRHHTKSGWRTDWLPTVEYAYTHNGIAMTGSKVSFRTITRSREYAQSIVDAHPLQSTCALSINPSDPTQTVLDPGADWMSAFPVGIGVFSLSFCSLFVWLTVRVTRRMLASLGPSN